MYGNSFEGDESILIKRFSSYGSITILMFILWFNIKINILFLNFLNMGPFGSTRGIWFDWRLLGPTWPTSQYLRFTCKSFLAWFLEMGVLLISNLCCIASFVFQTSSCTFQDLNEVMKRLLAPRYLHWFLFGESQFFIFWSVFRSPALSWCLSLCATWNWPTHSVG